MQSPILKLLAVGMGWLALSLEAFACSVIETYMPPSDFEIVGRADAIVVATAIDGTAGNFDYDGEVQFRVDGAIKGAPPVHFDTNGVVLIEKETDELGEFSGGMCGRVAFTRNKTYVVFLQKTDDGDGWQELPFLFASTSTDYEGAADPWVARIKGYLDIQQRFEPMEQFAQIDRTIAKLQNQPKSSERDAEVARLIEHVSARSPWKPTQYLVETYEQLERGQKLRWPMMEVDYGQSGGPKELSLDDQKSRVLLSLIDGQHEAAAPLFERLLAKPDISTLELGSAIAFVGLVSHDCRRAFDLIETRIVPRINELPVTDAMSLIFAANSAMNDMTKNGSEPIWKSDPVIAARWPRVAFGFLMFFDTRLGPGWLSFFGEMDALDPGDFQAWPEWTLLEARNYNDDLVAWAIAELKNEKLRTDHEIALAQIDPDGYEQRPSDPATLPMRALVRSWHKDRNEALRSMFCLGSTRRLLLISALGSDANPGDFDDDLIKSMLATPSLTDNDRDSVLAALAEIVGRAQTSAKARGLQMAPRDWRWINLIKVAVSGEKPKAKPIVCPSH